MILFMAYCVLIAGLLTLGCHLVEKCLLAFSLPTRFVWLAAVAFSIWLPIAGVVGRTLTPELQQSHPAEVEVAGLRSATLEAFPVLRSAPSLIETLDLALRPFDRALVLAWAIASALSLFAVLILAIRVRRLVRFTSAVTMAETEVRVTQHIGPALVGLFNYEIVVPQWVLGLAPRQQSLIVAHEREHAHVYDPAYFEFQVERPVVQIPGVGAPAYPAALRASRVEGEVQAQFVVNKGGQAEVGTFKILRATNDLFAAAMRSAFPNMRFSAAEIRGRKVRQIVHQSFQFRLDATSR